MKWTPPKWLNKIPFGSHGSNPVQKKVWKLTSDYVRIRDWMKYKKCVSCSKSLQNWNDGDAAHYLAWTICNSLFKYEPDNLALSCKYCNNSPSGDVGYRFALELQQRHGEGILERLGTENTTWHGEKLDSIELVEFATGLLDKMKDWEIKPDYYEEVMEKLLTGD